MIRLEILVLAIGNQYGMFDNPESKAFKLRNPLLLKTYRPEKKSDSDNYRIFTTLMGGYKAAVADVVAKCSGNNHRLTSANSLRDLLKLYGFTTDLSMRPTILFLRRGLDNTINLETKLEFFLEAEVEQVLEKES